ncbi:hypothetical protein E6H11_05230 [Candidatus Bathyarchaeota archaeon]|nr:MAG: hypothetical protein E6H11_05230 [Candidatus Bathyarchaeota archaeon]
MMYGHLGLPRPVGAISSSPTSGLFSWNPKVNCTAVLVSVEQIVGNQTGPQGGATEQGSVFNPGITSPYGPENTKRWLTQSSSTPPGWISPGPPCTITNANGQLVSAFVQINGVQRGFRAEEDWNSTFQRINGGSPYPNGPQSDTTFNVLTPGYWPCTSTNTTGCMHALHAEIDHDWKGASYCGPNTACDNNTLVAETAAYKSLIDVQGFVFWDPDHLNESAHNFSGWELHALTAWRLSNTSADFGLSANPNSLGILASLSASSTITVNTFNLFSGNITFSTVVSAASSTVGPSLTATMTPSSVIVPSGGIANSNLTVATAASSLGNYTVLVSGTNGTITRTVSVSVNIGDFGIAASPTSLSISIGASGTSTLTLASINGFSGAVNISAQVTPASLTAGLSPSNPSTSLAPSTVNLQPQSTGSSTLTVSASLLTTPGTYTVTITATSGTVSHTTQVPVTVTVAGLI